MTSSAVTTHVAKILAEACLADIKCNQLPPCACSGPESCRNACCTVVWEDLLQNPKLLRLAVKLAYFIKEET